MPLAQLIVVPTRWDRPVVCTLYLSGPVLAAPFAYAALWRGHNLAGNAAMIAVGLATVAWAIRSSRIVGQAYDRLLNEVGGGLQSPLAHFVSRHRWSDDRTLARKLERFAGERFAADERPPIVVCRGIIPGLPQMDRPWYPHEPNSFPLRRSLQPALGLLGALFAVHLLLRWIAYPPTWFIAHRVIPGGLALTAVCTLGYWVYTLSSRVWIAPGLVVLDRFSLLKADFRELRYYPITTGTTAILRLMELRKDESRVGLLRGIRKPKLTLARGTRQDTITLRGIGWQAVLDDLLSTVKTDPALLTPEALSE